MGGSSQVPQDFDTAKFQTKTKADRYEILKKMSFWPERRVTLKREAQGEFQMEIVRRHWEILANPPELYDPEVVLEFYANAFPERNQRSGRDDRVAMVRGIMVDYSRDAIEEYLQTGMGLELSEGWRDEYQTRLRSHTFPYDPHVTAELLCLPNFSFVTGRTGQASNIPRAHLQWLPRVWSTFILHNIAPNPHQSDTRMQYCYLMDAILRHNSIDIATIISREIHDSALYKGEKRGSIRFPSLITELCRRSRVPRVRPKEPIYDPITDDFIKTQRREAERAARQPPPPPPQQMPPPPAPDAPVTMEHFNRMLTRLQLSNDHLFLQNTALMRGQMHQQEQAYAYMEAHHQGAHSWLSPQDFARYTAWPGDRPHYPEEGEPAGADDSGDDGDAGNQGADIGADEEIAAHYDPFG